MKGKPPENISRYFGVNLLGIVLAFVIFVACAGTLTYVAERTGASSIDQAGEGAGAPGVIVSLNDHKNDAGDPEELSSASERSPVKVTPPKEKGTAEVAPAAEEKKKATEQKKQNSSSTSTSKPKKKPEKTETKVAITPSNSSSKKVTPPTKLVPENNVPEMGAGSIDSTVERVDPSAVKGVTPLWYSIHVGYTDSKMRADILRDVLVQQGFGEAQTVSTGEGTFYVSVGKYSFRYAADDAAKKIQDKTNLIPRIYEKTVAQ